MSYRRATPDEKSAGKAAPFETYEKGARVCRFETPGELAAWCRELGMSYTSDSGSLSSWMGGWSLSDAIDHATHGCPEEVFKIEQAIKDAAACVPAYDNADTLQLGIAGSYVDMGALMNGEPEHMVEFVTAPTDLRRVRIVVDAFVSADIESEEIEARGRVIAAAALALQGMGIMVEVSIKMKFQKMNERGSDACGETIDIQCDIWKSGRAFDDSILAAALCKVGFIRQLVFQAAVFAGRNAYQGIATGHGNLFHQIVPEPGDIMVAGMVWQSHPWTSPQAMGSFMDAVLNAASRSVDPQIFEERS